MDRVATSKQNYDFSQLGGSAKTFLEGVASELPNQKTDIPGANEAGRETTFHRALAPGPTFPSLLNIFTKTSAFIHGLTEQCQCRNRVYSFRSYIGKLQLINTHTIFSENIHLACG